MIRPSGIITIITDFGDTDYFVGAVKGAMVTINPVANIIDITNNIRPGDIRQASFVLMNSFSEFPSGTIHYCVVDPGVGSRRKALIVDDGDYFFVAPDNGVVYPSIEGGDFRAYEISKIGRRKPGAISSTFHGRDIFAPAASLLSKGIDMGLIGEPIEEIEHYHFPVPKQSDAVLLGEIIHIDHFGNLITNFRRDNLSELRKPIFRTNERDISESRLYYQEDKSKAPFYIEGSSGYMEISVCNSRADVVLGSAVGDIVILLDGADEKTD